MPARTDNDDVAKRCRQLCARLQIAGFRVGKNKIKQPPLQTLVELYPKKQPRATAAQLQQQLASRNACSAKTYGAFAQQQAPGLLRSLCAPAQPLAAFPPKTPPASIDEEAANLLLGLISPSHSHSSPQPAAHQP